jgi:hypothetical protein
VTTRRRVDALRRADRAEHALPVASALVCAVRDRDAAQVAQLLSAADLPALAVVLAACVPDDARMSELLDWTADLPQPKPAELQPHGTHAAYVRHWNRSEQPCELCVNAEREYQRNRKRSKRDSDPSRYRKGAA